MRSLAVVLALGLCFFACPPPADSLVIRLPDGTSSKDAAFDFGGRGAPVTRTFALVNPSQKSVALGDVTLDGAFSGSLAATELVAGGELPLAVTYTPAGDDTTTVTVRSPSGATLASLTLTGRFEGALCALPDVVDLGANLIGEAVSLGVPFPVQDTRRDVFVGAPPPPFQFPAGAPSGTQSVGAQESFSARIFLPAQTMPVELMGPWRLEAGGGCAVHPVTVRATAVDHVLSSAQSTLDFGSWPAPAQPMANVTLHNALSRVVSVNLEVQARGGGATTQFQLSMAKVDLPAATRDAQGQWRPGELEVPLTASLLGAGVVEGELVATTLGVGGMTEALTVPLVARGAGAGLSVLPSPLELQVPLVGSSLLPVSAALTISNQDHTAGAATRSITLLTVEADVGTSLSELCVGNFSASTGTCIGFTPLSLAPDESAVLPLTLHLTGAGPWRWFVTLHTDDTLAPELRVEVKARAQPQGDCALQQPQSLSIGAVRAPTPMVHALVLENQAQTPCYVQGAWVEGSPDVHVASNFTVLPGERKLVDVEYLPTTAPGTSALPTLHFSVNSVSAPLRTVPMEVASDDGCLFVSPEQFDFGVVGPTCGAREQSFGIGNRCVSGDVSVSAFSVRGTGPFTLSGMPEMRLAPNTFVPDALRVSFDPTAEGAFTGTLQLDVAVMNGTKPLVVPLRGVATTAARQRDRFVVPTTVDGLVVQDTTSTMSGLWTSLGAQAQSFIDAANVRARAVRLGAVEAVGGAGAGALRDLGGQKWADLELQPLQPLGALWGPSAASSANEVFREPALAALSGAAVTAGGANRAFLRRNASLSVAVVTDAKDQSTVPASVWLPQVLALKGSHRPERLSWSHVGPLSATAPSGCTYDDAVTSLPDELAASSATGGVQLEVCSVRATPSLVTSQLVPALFGDRDGFSLRSPIAAGATPSVFVGGVAVPETTMSGARNWSWDVTRRRVTLSGLALRSGDVVEFEYPTLCP